MKSIYNMTRSELQQRYEELLDKIKQEIGKKFCQEDYDAFNSYYEVGGHDSASLMDGISDMEDAIANAI